MIENSDQDIMQALMSKVGSGFEVTPYSILLKINGALPNQPHESSGLTVYYIHIF